MTILSKVRLVVLAVILGGGLMAQPAHAVQMCPDQCELCPAPWGDEQCTDFYYTWPGGGCSYYNCEEVDVCILGGEDFPICWCDYC
jgi:hypothetical protein